MPEIPLLTPKDVAKDFSKLGWEVKRQRGSHIVMTKPGSFATLSIPKHKQVARGTLRELIKSSGETFEDFIKALKK